MKSVILIDGEARADAEVMISSLILITVMFKKGEFKRTNSGNVLGGRQECVIVSPFGDRLSNSVTELLGLPEGEELGITVGSMVSATVRVRIKQ